MAGMLFSGSRVFAGFSLATMTVVAVAMLGSLTVLPALLSKLGDRAEKGRIPLLGRLRRRSGEPQPGRIGISSLPRSALTVESLDRIQAAFPGQAQPALVAVKTDTDSPAFKHAVAQLQANAVVRTVRAPLGSVRC